MRTQPSLLNERLRIGCGLLALVLLLGTVGFYVLESWSLVESFYTAVLVVSTLGFSDLRPTDTPGRLLTVVLIGGGVGTLYYLVGALAQNLIEEQFHQGKRRSVEQRIAQLNNHYIVCGFGRVGQETCNQLKHEGCKFVIIDADEHNLDLLQANGYLYIIGDAADDDVLRHARIDHARALMSAVPSDAINVYVTLSARALNPKLYIVARAATNEAVHKLKIAGANRVISPYILSGRSMAAMALRPAVMDFIDVLVHTADLEMWLEEIDIEPDSALAEAPISEAQLREKAGVTILAIRRADGQMIVNPPSSTIIHVGDMLIVLGTRSDLDRVEREPGTLSPIRD
jgi:voltage-gated potassium channel